MYKVVWPLSKSIYESIPLAPRIPDLRGKTICELYDWKFMGEEVFPLIRNLLRKRYPSVKFVDYTVFGNIDSHDKANVIAALPELLHKHGCNAVISGVGG